MNHKEVSIAPGDSDKFVVSSIDTITVEGVIEKSTDMFPQYRLKLNKPVYIVLKEYAEAFECEYLYFYDKSDLNGGYDYADLVGKSCRITACVENYRGGGRLFLLWPEVMLNN